MTLHFEEVSPTRVRHDMTRGQHMSMSVTIYNHFFGALAQRQIKNIDIYNIRDV